MKRLPKKSKLLLWAFLFGNAVHPAAHDSHSDPNKAKGQNIQRQHKYIPPAFSSHKLKMLAGDFLIRKIFS